MDRVAVIEVESSRFAEALAGVDPAERVPTCPDWSASDLLWHVTEVHALWGGLLERDGLTDADMEAVEEAKPARPDGFPEMLRLREQMTHRLLVQLREHPDDDAPLWSWSPAFQNVGFTRRMQTYEATIHRVDAELTAGGAVTAIDAEVAAGAVDHCVDAMWGWMPDWAAYEPLALVELHAPDTGRRWLVEVGHWTGTGPESGKAFDMMRAVRGAVGVAGPTGGGSAGVEPTAVVTGDVQHLARWAWGRAADRGSVRIEGDEAALAAVSRLLEQGLQ